MGIIAIDYKEQNGRQQAMGRKSQITSFIIGFPRWTNWIVDLKLRLLDREQP